MSQNLSSAAVVIGPLRVKPTLTLNAGEISKCKDKIFVQDIFCECRSIDQDLESQAVCFFCCVKSPNLRINQLTLCENKTK